MTDWIIMEGMAEMKKWMHNMEQEVVDKLALPRFLFQTQCQQILDGLHDIFKIHGPHRMNPADLSDPLTFSMVDIFLFC